jgi:hypothetical protein
VAGVQLPAQLTLQHREASSARPGPLASTHCGCCHTPSPPAPAQVKLLKEVGFDYAFNYKTHSKLEALDEAAPDGVDIYWENVGGLVLEKVLDIANNHARIVACGMVRWVAPAAST